MHGKQSCHRHQQHVPGDIRAAIIYISQAWFGATAYSRKVFLVSVSFSESSSSRFRHIAAANTRCDNSKAQARGLIAYTILHQPCKIGGGSRGHVLPASWRAGHMYQDTAQSPIFDCASSDQCTELTSRHLVSCARN